MLKGRATSTVANERMKAVPPQSKRSKPLLEDSQSEQGGIEQDKRLVAESNAACPPPQHTYEGRWRLATPTSTAQLRPLVLSYSRSCDRFTPTSCQHSLRPVVAVIS